VYELFCANGIADFYLAHGFCLFASLPLEPTTSRSRILEESIHKCWHLQRQVRFRDRVRVRAGVRVRVRVRVQRRRR
jgi:hypothetical protein